MTSTQLEKQLLKYTKGLSKDALSEIIDFILFVRKKRMKESPDNISSELTKLDTSQLKHLEEEFKNYKQLYPNEKE